MHKRKLAGLIALGAAASLALAGCSNGSADGGSDGDKGTITLGYLPAWTDGLSTAYLLQDQLERLGYTVEMDEQVDAGVLYTSLSEGGFDVYPSAWPEVTHASYMEEYGDRIDDLGAYYEGAVLTIAVPEYVDIDSIEELKGAADRFEGKIYGIEPGAGLTAQTQDVMMPEYGLDDEYELVTSSTATMLTTLEDKIDREEDVVVTLWRPFWANDAYPVKDLEDPKGAMGDPEALHFLGKSGFADEFPEAAEYISKIKLDDAAYAALESLVTGDEYEGDPEGAVDAWLAEHGDAYEGLMTD
ncbi:glycine betaine ABC transporter substrate-binding protein [Leucobacter ruminantium]|uniref:Glycine betaine ABC transporter substrate-binding protein n=1 Tax=Leucobacter ruminantium TaxID=1289170 RepID=A0A939RTS3_9MICO|nr:glycine betaine ABC transporter substrate-binding protein [Leucobacter ruminantium]MBO1804770.1 glycine betaine ABC transporter substrate-binding protein [Leucobacter ruminantium]